jgi:hypothetical protein
MNDHYSSDLSKLVTGTASGSMITMFMVNYKENDSILTKKLSDPQSIQ